MIINGFGNSAANPALVSAAARIKRNIVGNIVLPQVDTYSHTPLEVYNQLNTSNSKNIGTLTVQSGISVSCTTGHTSTNFNSILKTQVYTLPFEVQYIPGIFVFRSTTNSYIPTSYITKTGGDSYATTNAISIIISQGYKFYDCSLYTYTVGLDPNSSAYNIISNTSASYSGAGYVGTIRSGYPDSAVLWMGTSTLTIGAVVTSSSGTLYGTLNTAFSVNLYWVPVQTW